MPKEPNKSLFRPIGTDPWWLTLRRGVALVIVGVYALRIFSPPLFEAPPWEVIKVTLQTGALLVAWSSLNLFVGLIVIAIRVYLGKDKPPLD